METFEADNLSPGVTDRIQGDLRSPQSDSKLNTYKYTPLGHPRDIRLLTLEAPDPHESVAHCRLITSSLDRPERYMTLSYAWGETHEDGRHLTHQILVDGKMLRLTESLHSAILRLREVAHFALRGTTPWKETPCLLWADAVCIDQCDPEEREAQVLLMSEIYSKSACLTVWLGEAPIGDEGPGVKVFDTADPRPVFNCMKSQGDLRQLRCVLNLPWFKRRWIIQEVVNTILERRFVQLGHQRFRWPTFLAGIRDTKVPSHERKNILREHLLLQTLDNRHDSRYTILQNLHEHHDADCFDGRDRVYALRSLSDDAHLIPVSYSTSVHSLYMRIARIFASKHLEALLLSAALRLPPIDSSTSVGSKKFPTWVPDWECPVYTSYYHTMELEEAINARFSPACDDLDISSGTYNPIDRSLAVEGWLFEDADESLDLRFSELFLDPGILHESPAGRFKRATWLVLEGCNFAFVVHPANHHAQPHLLEQYRFYELCGFRHFSSHWRGRDDLNFTENGNPSDRLDRGRKEKIYLV